MATPRKRLKQTQEVPTQATPQEEVTTEQAVTSVLGDMMPDLPSKRSKKKKEITEEVVPVARSEPLTEEFDFDAVEYIRKQTNLQVYGKEEPTEYDRILVRLNERSQ